MEPGFTIKGLIAKPVDEVFDAVRNPDKLSKYFTTTASGPIEHMEQLTWTWGEHSAIVEILEVRENKLIRFSWPAWKVEYDTTVEMSFEEQAGGTMVSITETDWDEDEAGLLSSYEHCAGWQHMLLSMKGWLIFGIDLRTNPAS